MINAVLLVLSFVVAPDAYAIYVPTQPVNVVNFSTAGTSSNTPFYVTNLSSYGVSAAYPMYISVVGTITASDVTRVAKAGDTMTGELVGTTITASALRVKTNTYYTQFKTDGQTTDMSYILPSTIGASGQMLTNDGSGNLSWRYTGVSGIQEFYLTRNLSGIGFYLAQSSLPATTAYNESTATVSGTDILISSYVTPSGYPTSNVIPSGEWNTRIYGYAANANRIYAYAKYYEIKGDLSEVFIGQSVNSGYVGTTLTELNITMSTNVLTLVSGSRVAVRIYVTNSGPSTTLYGVRGGGYYSLFSIPGPVANVTNFVPYTGAAGNVDIDGYSMTATQFNGSSMTLTGKIIATNVAIGSVTAITSGWGIEISTPMHFVGNGVYWDDLRTPILNAKPGPSYPPDFRAFRNGVYLYSFANEAVNEDEVYLTIQMPHGWDGSKIDPHLHYSVVDASAPSTSDTIVFGLEYTCAQIGGQFPTTSVVKGTTTLVSPYYDGYLDFDDITIPDGGGVSPQCAMRLYRNSSSATDNFTGGSGVYAIEMDFHFKRNSLGSRQETAK